MSLPLTSFDGIKPHLRPLVHPVGLPRKQALRSRLSPGPARECVLLPKNIGPFMEMGSSRLFSLISTLQKSAEQESHMVCTEDQQVQRGTGSQPFIPTRQ